VGVTFALTTASSYLQLFFNLAMIGFILYVINTFVESIKADISLKAEEYSMGEWLPACCDYDR
jgi:hypothetical protein